MALAQNIVKTSNGMKAFSTTANANTDLFSSIGSLRGASNDEIVRRFTLAYTENPEYALRIALYSRDILEGQGEKNTPKQIFLWLAQNHPNVLTNNLHLIPELGYWKDLMYLFNTPVEAAVLRLIAQGFNAKNGLCAKWMPRKGEIANKIRKSLNLTPKDYRKLLVSLTNVVETKMCNGQWDQINYQHVPSKAGKLYRKAFKKRDGTRYEQFISAVEKGEAKINAKALMPHEIVGEYFNKLYSIDRTLEAQWKALPDLLAGNETSFLPMCDVSGSMNGLPMNVCVALGIYLSERNIGPFKNAFVTFSTNPQLQVLTKQTLFDRVNELRVAQWSMSTDFEKAMKLVLKAAVQNNLPAEHMPKMLLVMSDMQFNEAGSFTAYEMIADEYEKAGYIMPQIVFWNLNAVAGHSPVSYNQQNVALVSGFSPNIMKQLLSGGVMTPEYIMLQTIMSDRYKVVI